LTQKGCYPRGAENGLGNHTLTQKGCYRAMYPKMSQITLKKCVQLTSENKFAKQKNHPIHHRVAL